MIKNLEIKCACGTVRLYRVLGLRSLLQVLGWLKDEMICKGCEKAYSGDEQITFSLMRD